MAYTADGQKLVIAAGRTIEVLDSNTLKPLTAPVHLSDLLGSVDPSPDGRFAFVTLLTQPLNWHTMAPVNTGALVDLRTGQVVHRGRLPILNAHFAAFSPRGDQVAVVGDAGQVLLFDVDAWRPVAPTASPNGPLTMWVAYNSDGTRVLTAAGQQAQLWDTATGQEIGVVSVLNGASAGSFRPDGTVRLADKAGGVFTWDPSLEHDIAFACHAAGRDITPDEWHAAFPDLAYRKVCAA